MGEKKTKKKIKKDKAIIILVLIVIIFSALTCIIYTRLKPAEIRTIEMYLTVSNYTGFDVNTSALIFGTVIPSSYVQRTINITNIDENIHKICIKPTGKLAKWIAVSEAEFILKGNESKEIKVKINVPYDAEYGKYTGSLKIIFR